MANFGVTFTFDDAAVEAQFYDAFVDNNRQAFTKFMNITDGIFTTPPTLQEKKDFVEQAAAETYRANFANLTAQNEIKAFQQQKLSEKIGILVVTDKSKKG